jgi:hypothetical protein
VINLNTQAQMAIDFDRDSLYLEVSATPISALAKKYGLSDVGLRKVCIRLNIPLPGRGHWQKLAAGKPSTMPPLPPTKGLTRFECNPIEVMLTPSPAQAEWLEARLSFEKDPVNRITVSSTLDAPTALVRQTRKVAEKHIFQIEQSRIVYLARGKNSDTWLAPRLPTLPEWSFYRRKGHLELAGENLPMRVSMESVDRALRIWDALIKAAKKRGLAPAICDGCFRLSANGQHVGLRIAERIERVAGSTKGLSSFDMAMGRHVTMRATGELRITIGERKFSDGESASLDQQLNDVFSYVSKALNRERIRDLERTEQRRLDEEKRTQAVARAEEAKERAKRLAEDREREAELDAEAAAWRRAQEIRAYAAAVSEAAPLPAPAHVREWIDWANSVASRIDPLPSRVAVVGAAAPAVLATPRTKEAES